MDFKKLGERAGRLKKQAEDKLGDRAEPDNLKRDGKELRSILAGDGSLAEKAKEAKQKVIDRDPGQPEASAGEAETPPAEAPVKKPARSSDTPENPTGEGGGKATESGQ